MLATRIYVDIKKYNLSWKGWHRIENTFRVCKNHQMHAPLHEGISIIISPDAGFTQGYIFHYSYSPICWLQQYVSACRKILSYTGAGIGSKMPSKCVQPPDASPLSMRVFPSLYLPIQV